MDLEAQSLVSRTDAAKCEAAGCEAHTSEFGGLFNSFFLAEFNHHLSNPSCLSSKYENTSHIICSIHRCVNNFILFCFKRYSTRRNPRARQVVAIATERS